MMPDAGWRLRGAWRGADYDARFEAQAAAGKNVHGEADFVERLGLRSVLDAGCGTGRVARELARRGLQTVGVDRDAGMLAVARDRAPHLVWHEADLVTMDLGRTFDAIVLAGNVMLFLAPGTEAPCSRTSRGTWVTAAFWWPVFNGCLAASPWPATTRSPRRPVWSWSSVGRPGTGPRGDPARTTRCRSTAGRQPVKGRPLPESGSRG